MKGTWLTRDPAVPWIAATAVALVAIQLAGESCRDKIIGDDLGIEACSTIQKASYEDPLLWSVVVIAAAFLGYTLVRIANAVERD